MTDPVGEPILTRDLSSGRIHRRMLVNGVVLTAEADNLDQAGTYELITADDLANAEPGELCERCFPPIGGDDAAG